MEEDNDLLDPYWHSGAVLFWLQLGHGYGFS